MPTVRAPPQPSASPTRYPSRNRRTLGLVQRDSDEDAWRGIVENYGDRVELDDEPPVEPAVESRPEERLERLFRPLPQPDDTETELDDGFVPPTPPPLPKLPPDRLPERRAHPPRLCAA